MFPGRAGHLGGDADIGEESLLSVVELVKHAALAPKPSLGGGVAEVTEADVGTERPAGCGVAGPVDSALLLASSSGEPSARRVSVVKGGRADSGEVSVFGGVGAGLGEGFFGVGPHVESPGAGGGRRRGIDAGLGEEALLFGVEGGVAGAF
ncbi:hypothetical protein [Streptomyces sp. NPDC017949]|uniref:hypothetical protein n=1 Tax=Streptomyces sp. NPDC017949 TaxID=3365020 RepID=UPI0037A2F754